ncbi:hypothetical protein JHK82_045917 [Glycine max]|uniref:Uncharacterized protein n=2 Tax=Glycine subgen. Soja TaxID=1462606 RepID=A0A0R0FKN8_SOYBN|nr:hypothetical protein JHK87_044081 [Glycine soja]KAG4950971.1 hypothetical protein JHK85_044838 [Glycine max]KAG5100865.1 hypothetical protein JHK82_045917 [Glycine max]KAH1149715.1 hypothetical protein GYH30_043980 [Glycine max]KAH1149716.1 hypothetical protein GYH30_043980 [Glycine max]
MSGNHFHFFGFIIYLGYDVLTYVLLTVMSRCLPNIISVYKDERCYYMEILPYIGSYW